MWSQERREEGQNPLAPQRTEVGAQRKERNGRLREEMIVSRAKGGLEQIPQGEGAS